MKKTLFVFILMSALAGLGCGVKGDPLPPLRPAEIGRGKPSYKKALRKVDVSGASAPSEDASDDESEDEQDQSEEGEE